MQLRTLFHPRPPDRPTSLLHIHGHDPRRYILGCAVGHARSQVSFQLDLGHYGYVWLAVERGAWICEPMRRAILPWLWCRREYAR